MANERMYLYCRNCGSRLYLGKHSCGAFHFSSGYAKQLPFELQKFYEEHAYCIGELCDSDLSEDVDKRYETDYPYVSDFGIVYESSDIYTKLSGGDNL